MNNLAPETLRYEHGKYLILGERTLAGYTLNVFKNGIGIFNKACPTYTDAKMYWDGWVRTIARNS